MRWYRYTVVLVGLESGTVSLPLDAIRFRHLSDAQAWCDQMNDPDNDRHAHPYLSKATAGLTQWQPITIPR